MTIRVQIHLEAPSPEREVVWWAESPDVPGLSVLDESLQALLIRAEMAVRDIVAEQGGHPGETRLAYELVENQPAASGPDMQLQPLGEGPSSRETGENPRVAAVVG